MAVADAGCEVREAKPNVTDDSVSTPHSSGNLAATCEETIGMRISKIGIGWYQIQAYILCCGFIIAEGAALATTSANVIAVSLDFDIPKGFHRSFLMTCLFMGFATGTLAAGPLGDYFGRKATMLVGYIGIVLSASLMFLNNLVIFLYLFNFILGLFAGFGIPVAFITIAEITPQHLRGITTAATGVAFALGELWAAIGLRWLNPSLKAGPWRKLVVWSAIPSLILIMFGLLSKVARHDTAHWLGCKRRNKDVVQVINLMAEMNGALKYKLQDDDVLAGEPTNSDSICGSLTMLTKSPLLLRTIVLGIIFFAKDFLFYGSGVFWPVAWMRARALGELAPATELMLTAVCGIPGFGIAMHLMHKLPRRSAFSIAGCNVCVGAYFMTYWNGWPELGVVGVVLFKLNFPTLQMVTMLLPSEIFPMQIKSTGFSLVALCGRFATIAVPMVVGASHNAFLCAVAALSLAAALLVYALPETSCPESNGQTMEVAEIEAKRRTSESAPLKAQAHPGYGA